MARATLSAPASNLTQRLLTAAVGLPLLALVLWAGGVLFAALAVLATAVALWEALTLTRRAGWATLLEEGIAWGVLVVLGTAAGGWTWPAFGVGGLAVAVAAIIRRRSRQTAKTWAFTAAVVAYVALSVAAIVAVRNAPGGLDWVLLAFLAVFATDTGAYAVGKVVGRHRMAPSISPGKTWEGAAGGLAAAVAATVALTTVLDAIAPVVWASVALGVAVAVIAQAGDLLESKLKRLAGAKDSGKLFPGHGGLLDRMDSLVPVFPLIYYAAMVWPA